MALKASPSTLVAESGGLHAPVLNETVSITLADDLLNAPASLQWDLRVYRQVSLTFKATVQSVDIYISVSNKSDFSDAVNVISNVALASGATSYWVMGGGNALIPTTGIYPGFAFSYLRVRLENTGAGANGTLETNICAKT